LFLAKFVTPITVKRLWKYEQVNALAIIQWGIRIYTQVFLLFLAHQVTVIGVTNLAKNKEIVSYLWNK